MKTNIKSLVLIAAVFLTITSFKKNTSLPSETVTTYTGDLAYTPTGRMPIANTAGKATISGSKGNYTISISDNVPSLTGLRFDKESKGNYVTESKKGSVVGINIDGNTLSVSKISSGANWGFTGTK